MKRSTRRLYWRLCCLAFVALSFLSFTSLVIPPGITEPMLGSLPRTLWSGILIAFAILIVTLAGVIVHPDGAPRSEDEQ
jgi:hypothetical protein